VVPGSLFGKSCLPTTKLDRFIYGPLLIGLPGNVLQVFVVWLLFKLFCATPEAAVPSNPDLALASVLGLSHNLLCDSNNFRH